MKWSDGKPFTSEDVMFPWNDVTLYSPDPEVKPSDLFPTAQFVGGEAFEFDAVDDYTVVIRTAAPYTDFDMKLYQWLPLPLPVHFLEQFHPKYAESDKDPTEMWQDFQNIYASRLNLDKPVIGPWIPDTVKEGDSMTMKRNPYYWKVDPEGKQLPYVNGMRSIYIKDHQVFILRAVAGEIDWDEWGVTDPVMFQNQQQGNYTMLPKGDYYAVFKPMLAWISETYRNPDSSPEDKKLADLLVNEKFLEALQLGLDNEQLTSAFAGPDIADFIGLPLSHSRLTRGLGVGADPRSDYLWEWLKEWQRFDPEEANVILDELELKVGSDGYRHYPDGTRLDLTVGIFTDRAEAEVHEMAVLSWEENLKIRVLVERNTWSGAVVPWWVQGGIPLLSSFDIDRVWNLSLDMRTLYQYPIYDWVASGGEKGIEPHPKVKDTWLELYELQKEQVKTTDPDKKYELALEATELTLKNHVSLPLMFAGRSNSVYAHNRVQNGVVWPAWGGVNWVRWEQRWIKE